MVVLLARIMATLGASDQDCNCKVNIVCPLPVFVSARSLVGLLRENESVLHQAYDSFFA